MSSLPPLRASTGIALVAGWLCCGQGPLAASAVAGTRITNTASAEFNEAGTRRAIRSNTTELVVDELLECQLAAADGPITGPITDRGTEIIAAFRLHNAGNGPEAQRLSAAVLSQSGAPTGDDATLAIDADGDGRFDAAMDRLLAQNEATPEIAPGGALTAFVLVPTSADRAGLQIVLTSACATGTGQPGTPITGAGAGGGSAVVGRTGAMAQAVQTVTASTDPVAVVKAALVQDPFGGAQAMAGARIRYTLRVSLKPGRTVEELVLTDPIPAGTAYLAGSLELDGHSLTDGPDGDGGEADASRIAVSLPQLTPSAPQSVSFSVVVK